MKGMIIKKQDIEPILSGYGLSYIDSYDFEDKHRIEINQPDGNTTLPEAFAIMGIKFIHTGEGIVEKKGNEPYFAHIYECVFANEVLDNSLKITFENSK